MSNAPARMRLTFRLAATLVLSTSVAGPLGAQNASIRVTVRNAITGTPIVDASILASTANRRCVTAGDGSCRLLVNAGATELRATAIGFAPDSKSVLLSPGESRVVAFTLQPSAAPLDRVITVGTRALERTVSQSTVPVEVLSSQLLEATGLPETWQQLQRLVPSVNVPHIPIGDNHMRPVTLRGLAPHHVLVLVNGKRRHPSSVLLAGPSVAATAFTDLSSIPTAAIERIEIVRDVAAAQYGSDAIGGVVNIVLRSGARRDLNVSAGQVHSSEGGRDFRDGQFVRASGTLGLSAASGAHVTVSAEAGNRNGTNRAYPDKRPQYFGNDPRNLEPPRVSSYLGNGAADDVGILLSAGLPLGTHVEAYAFGGGARTSGDSPDAFFRRPLDPRTVRAIHPDGFLPLISSDIADRSALAGIRGELHGWRWDVSSGWGGARVAYAVSNSNNVSLGAASPTSFDAGRVAAQQWTNNADVARELRIGSVPVNVAGGMEVRLERYQIRAGEPDSWRDGESPILDGPLSGRPADVGAQGMVGYRPVDEASAQRVSSAVYVEGDVRPLSRLLLQSAGRIERYGDVGTTTNGKFAARFELLRGVALRGSLGTGFRAPALAQQHFSSTRTVYVPVDGVNTVLTVRTFPVNTPEARLMGAAPLRPERSVNHGAGLVLDAPRFPLLTADVFELRIEDRIILGSSVTDPSIIRLFEENGMRGIGGGNYFANGIDTRTRGMEVVASHGFLLGRNDVLRLVAAYSHTKSVVTRVLPPPPELAAFGAVLFNRTSRGIIERGQPRETLGLTMHYATGRWELNLHNQRSGPTAQLDQLRPEADQVLRAKWFADARVGYRLRPRLQVAVSAANLFDVYPDEWRDFQDGPQGQGPSMQGIFRYPGALSPFGMNGRTVNVQMTYR